MVLSRMPIVGVVGTTGEATVEVSRLADEAGRAVVAQGCALLTGGKPFRTAADPLRKPVKDAAMDGAAAAGSGGVRARLIAVLPDQPRADAMLTQFNANTFALIMWTRLTRHQRNYFTGRLPDAVIALKGGAGTLSEIGLAHQAGRPVVFLDSLDDLQEVFRTQKEAVHAILKEVEAVFRGPNPVEVLDSLGGLLAGNKTAARARNPVEAVEAVRALIPEDRPGGTPTEVFSPVEELTVSGAFFAKQLQDLFR